MLFTDPVFLFYFLPITLLLIRLAGWRNRLTNTVKIFIIGATLMFYSYENWLWTVVFFVIIGGTYIFGWIIHLATDGASRKISLGFIILYLLSFLGAFKYLSWLSSLWHPLLPLRNSLLPWFGSSNVILLPPGISFYIFEAISYCFDIYRKRVIPPRNPLDFLCFITMFPRFIAGPIVRYADLEGQLKEWRGTSIAPGLALFSIGFGMKCFFADQFSIFTPYAFDVPRPDFTQAWVGVASYSFQLYFDFWAYSTMATGLGLCLGFQFPDNFRSPYHALSMAEFWRRWHISLSTWLRDYLYIPLGGNRASLLRVNFNLLLTMALGGIWHGANLTFVLWGTYHGLLLIIERSVGENRLGQLPRLARHVVTLLLIAVGWTLFRSSTSAQAWMIIKSLSGINGLFSEFNPVLMIKNPLAVGLSITGMLFCIWGERLLVRSVPLSSIRFGWLTQVSFWAVLIISLLISASSVDIPFLYFQF